MRIWLRIPAGRRKLTESSEVETAVPGGALVRIAQPSGASAMKASVPARKTPAPDCHQGLAGIAKGGFARPTSGGRRTLNGLIGGVGKRGARAGGRFAGAGSRARSGAPAHLGG